jgi:hypothetical protein
MLDNIQLASSHSDPYNISSGTQTKKSSAYSLHLNVEGPPTYGAGKVQKIYYDFFSRKHMHVDKVKYFAWQERYDFSFLYNFRCAC